MYWVDANNKILTLLVLLSKSNNIRSLTNGILKKYLEEDKYNNLCRLYLFLYPSRKVDQWLGIYKWNLLEGITANFTHL